MLEITSFDTVVTDNRFIFTLQYYAPEPLHACLIPPRVFDFVIKTEFLLITNYLIVNELSVGIIVFLVS